MTGQDPIGRFPLAPTPSAPEIRSGDETAILAMAARFNDSAIIVTDAQKRIEWVNPAFEMLSGYTLEELRGQMPDRILSGPATSMEERRRIDGHIARGESFYGDLVNYHKSGYPYWVEVQVHPVLDPDGSLTSCLAIETDVSERKRKDALTAARTAVLERLAEDAPLEAVLTTLAEALDGATPEMHVSILRCDAEGRLWPLASPKLPSAYSRAIEGVASGEGVGSCGTAAHRRETVITPDILTDTLWSESRRFAELSQMRACWSQPIQAPDGAVLGIFALFHENIRRPQESELDFLEEAADLAAMVMERKRLEDEANRAAAAYRAIFEQTPVGLGRTTPGGRWLDVNPALARMLGYDSPAQMIEETEDLAKDFYADPQERAIVMARTNAAGTLQGHVHRVKTRDGGRLWARTDVHAEYADDGEVAAYACAVVDVTSEQQAREELAASERRFRIMADALPPSIVYIDSNACYAFANAAYCKAKGVGPADLQGRHMSGVVGEARWRRLKPCVEAALRGERIDFEDAMEAPDGSQRDLYLSYVPDVTADGEVRGFFALLTDISEFKRREAELVEARDAAEAASRAKSSFLATMSHELRTPLNAIIGYSDAMTQQIFGPLGHPKYAEYAGDILTSGHHLRELISSVLDLSGKGTDESNLSIEALDIKQVAGEAVRMSTQGRDASVTLAIADGLAVRADQRALRQIIINLVDNALKYAPGAPIHVTAAVAYGRCRIAVRDEGEGIPDEDVAHVLSPFYRGRRGAEVAGPGGVGLGLSLVKHLVEAQSGRLEVASKPGQGTTIVVDLPACDAAETAAQRGNRKAGS